MMAAVSVGRDSLLLTAASAMLAAFQQNVTDLGLRWIFVAGRRADGMNAMLFAMVELLRRVGRFACLYTEAGHAFSSSGLQF